MGFKDHFSGHAADYGSHRPTYPRALFEFLASQVSQRSLAWDCATGNGQAASGLAEFFDRVIASDASEQQVTSACGLPSNVDLRVALAEASGLAEQSVDLVTVAQALHWFDFKKFYAELRRVLVPGGVVAVWSYGLTRIGPAVDALIDGFYRGELDAFWPPERVYVESGYRDIPFPFDELAVPEYSMVVGWSLDDLLNYLRTWSAVRRLVAARGGDPVGELEPGLRAIWGDGQREVRWPLFLRVGRLA